MMQRNGERRTALWMALVFALAAAGTLHGQTTTSGARADKRFQLLINGGFAGGNSFVETATKTVFVEEATSRRDYEGAGGPVFEIGGLFSITPALGVLGSLELFSGDRDAVFEELVPHPLFFDQDRSVAGDLTGLGYSENAIHIDVVYSIERQAVSVDLFGGPSVFFVETELVSDVATTSSYPFDDLALTSTSTSTFSESPIGFNVGGAFVYRFTRVVGVAVQGRFSRAAVSIEAAEGGEPIEFDAGGFRLSVGIRLAF